METVFWSETFTNASKQEIRSQFGMMTNFHVARTRVQYSCITVGGGKAKGKDRGIPYSLKTYQSPVQGPTKSFVKSDYGQMPLIFMCFPAKYV